MGYYQNIFVTRKAAVARTKWNCKYRVVLHGNIDEKHFAAKERWKEGILPALESGHAIKASIDKALRFKETGEGKTIVFGLTGTGYFDMTAYEKIHDGKMEDHIPTDEDLQVSLNYPNCNTYRRLRVSGSSRSGVYGNIYSLING